MTNPNLVNTSQVFMRSNIQVPISSVSDILENPSASNMIIRADVVTICNTTATAADIDVYLTRSAVTYAIAKTVSVPAYSSMVVLDKDYPVYLEEGDKIQVSGGSGLQAICSYTIISDTTITLPERPTINSVSNVVVTYIGVTDTGTDGTSFNFNNVNIGSASSDRLVVAIIQSTGGSSGATKTTMTINGNAMNDVHNISRTFGNHNVAYFKVTSGTTANVAISYTNTKSRSSCAIYTITGQSSDTPSDTDSQTTASLTVDLPTNSGGIFTFGAISATVTTTWSGATEDLDQAVGGEGTTSISTASAVDQTTAYNVTLTHSATPDTPVYTATVWT
jgi:hypothetical protein